MCAQNQSHIKLASSEGIELSELRFVAANLLDQQQGQWWSLWESNPPNPV